MNLNVEGLFLVINTISVLDSRPGPVTAYSYRAGRAALAPMRGRDGGWWVAVHGDAEAMQRQWSMSSLNTTKSVRSLRGQQ